MQDTQSLNQVQTNRDQISQGQINVAVFGGGCFWCVEAVFQRLKGVRSVSSGYAGGNTDGPTYEQVSTGRTGHVEVIKVEYDPNLITYQDLLNVFFASHDPTSVDKQGNDSGPQYRSVIFSVNEEQRQLATDFISHLGREKIFSLPIVTAVEKLDKFFPAEDYHQNFYNNNQNYPYCTFVINPKLLKLRQKFSHLLKPE